MNLTGALQENVLTLLCFDKHGAAVISGTIDVDLFESSVYRNIAKAAAGYYRKYKKAAADHLPDLLEDLLKEKRKGKLYARTLHDLKELSETINADYVLEQLAKFVRRQTLRKSVTEAAVEIQRDDLDKAESIILKGVRTRLAQFQPGTRISDPRNMDKLEANEAELIGTGIRELDARLICPAYKELFTVLGPRGRGKTWFMCHLGKFAALQHKKVSHISLEMPEWRLNGRYLQSFFSLTKREATEIRIPQFVIGSKGNLRSIGWKLLKKRSSISNPTVRKKIGEKLEQMGGRMQIIVKQFPTSQLTIDGLVAYLESLEEQEGFHPDMVVLDYADLMKIDTANLRLDTGRIYREYRGLAVERGFAGVTGSQTNRLGEDVKLLTVKYFAEDITKADISDNIITYNQTKQEKPHGLARLFVAKGRNEQDGQTILISQAYGLGQFCLDSHLLRTDHLKMLPKSKTGGDDD